MSYKHLTTFERTRIEVLRKWAIRRDRLQLN